MYIVLLWLENDNYLTHIANPNGSIRCFESIKEADEYANGTSFSDSMRVISIEGVKD